MGHKNQAAGQIWPVSHSWLTCGLDPDTEGLEEFSVRGRSSPTSPPCKDWAMGLAWERSVGPKGDILANPLASAQRLCAAGHSKSAVCTPGARPWPLGPDHSPLPSVGSAPTTPGLDGDGGAWHSLPAPYPITPLNPFLHWFPTWVDRDGS